MRNDTEHPFSLTIIQSDMRLQVLRLNGQEALNQPYRFDLDLIGLMPPISPDVLLGQAAFLRLEGQAGIHGVVHSISLTAGAAHRVGYRVTLVPYLQQLEQGPRRRIFHRLSVVEILQNLLEDNALPAHSYRFELPNGQYPRRPFCIQYEESDLTLLQRLCEEEGIHYHFEHTPQGHVLVFAEDPKSFPLQSAGLLSHAEADKRGTITRLYQRHHSVLPGPPEGFRDRAVAEETNPTLPVPQDSTHERMRDDPAKTHRFQAGRRRLERLRYRKREIHGHTTSSAMRSGHIAQIDGHPVSTFNDQWLITEVRHRGPSITATGSARFPGLPCTDRPSSIPSHAYPVITSPMCSARQVRLRRPTTKVGSWSASGVAMMKALCCPCRALRPTTHLAGWAAARYW